MTIATSQPVPAIYQAKSDTAYRRIARHKTRSTLIWIALLLALAESGLRVRAWYRHGSSAPVAGIYERDALLGRRPRPGATLDGSGRRLSINRWGFRGADFPLAKPAGTTRIAVLGDSTSFGMEAADDDSVWVAQLVSLLNDHHRERYEAINGAVPGYSLGVSIRRLVDRIARFEPDVVVAYQVAADMTAQARKQFPTSKASKDASSTLTRYIQEHSLLLNLIRLNTTAFKARNTPQERRDRLGAGAELEYEGKLRLLVESCRDNGWRLILCTCPRAFGDTAAPTDQHTLAASALANTPELSLAGLNDAYERYNDVIRAVARENGAELVDLDRFIPKRGDFFVDAIHLNDTGHRMAAEAVAAVLER